jgi:hypothetical protein
MAVIDSGDNCVALTGVDQFVYFLSHFNMSSKDAIEEMRSNDQDLDWFDAFTKEQQEYVLSKRFQQDWDQVKEQG